MEKYIVKVRMKDYGERIGDKWVVLESDRKPELGPVDEADKLIKEEYKQIIQEVRRYNSRLAQKVGIWL